MCCPSANSKKETNNTHVTYLYLSLLHILHFAGPMELSNWGGAGGPQLATGILSRALSLARALSLCLSLSLSLSLTLSLTIALSLHYPHNATLCNPTLLKTPLETIRKRMRDDACDAESKSKRTEKLDVRSPLMLSETQCQ